MQSKMVKTLSTIGGKSRLLKFLIPIMINCIETNRLVGFIDVFGGGNKIIPNLHCYLHETIYNDIDRGFSNVMMCCSNIDLLQEMIDKAYQYQFNIDTEEKFEYACRLRLNPSISIVDSAALTIIVQSFSRAADRKNYSKSDAKRGISYESLQRFKELYPSMSNTTVLCTDYKNVLELYKNRSDFLIYLDPPYYGTNSYENNIDHVELAESIVESSAYIILSNFDNPIYEEILVNSGWNKYSLGVIAKSSSAKRGSIQQEFIWSNFPIPDYLLPQFNIFE
ncbi:DNA adenine methylase [Ureibacillus thermosphaericus]|uniref:DNA adenine methylase n=1 Tax=Ureibacillus thermosphaericus TaxID=51173 RepID=UPI000BBC4385|nr:DNA adenine methylase [Ureibacillus thermosphaericus]